MIVVTGDHGEALGSHGEETHGLFAYEATLHVPLIIAQIDRKTAPWNDVRLKPDATSRDSSTGLNTTDT